MSKVGHKGSRNAANGVPRDPAHDPPHENEGMAAALFDSLGPATGAGMLALLPLDLPPEMAARMPPLQPVVWPEGARLPTLSRDAQEALLRGESVPPLSLPGGMVLHLWPLGTPPRAALAAELPPEMAAEAPLLDGLALALGASLDLAVSEARRARLHARLEGERVVTARLLETGATGILSLDGAGRVVFANATAAALLGEEAADLTGQDIGVLAPRLAHMPSGASVARNEIVFAEVLANGAAIHDCRFRYRRPDGRLRYLSLNVAPFSADILPDARLGLVLTDITEATLAEADARRNADLLEGLFHHTPNGVALLDGRTGRAVEVNPALCALTGRSADSLLGAPLAETLSPGSPMAPRMAAALAERGRFGPDECALLRPDGTRLTVKVSAFALGEGGVAAPDGTAPPRGVSAAPVWIILEDVTARRAEADRLRHEAHHDELTGLPNRRLFRDHLAAALESARRASEMGAVLLIDLDSFKLINDTMGHAAGDAFLCEIAARLLAFVRPGEQAARLGGDEFALLLARVKPPRVVKLRGRELIEALG
ncbi:MAG: diguanylate cyclase, partial [Rhodobacteraceae bacterium]|nr:diguanylate cyclase [Paracoccaceae bacterium]